MAGGAEAPVQPLSLRSTLWWPCPGELWSLVPTKKQGLEVVSPAAGIRVHTSGCPGMGMVHFDNTSDPQYWVCSDTMGEVRLFSEP